MVQEEGGGAHSILDEVRAACASLESELVSVDDAAVEELASTLDAAACFGALERAPGLRFPIRFSDAAQEVSFIATMSLLHFGGGFRSDLAEHHGGDTLLDCVTRAMFGMAISGRRLDADYMCSVSEHELAELFGVPVTVDVPDPNLPVVSVATDSPLRPLLRLLRSALEDTGRRLRELREESLGTFVLARLPPPGAAAAAGTLVGALAAAFPAFADAASAPGQPQRRVVLLNKAQRCVAELWRRFRRDDPRFAFADAPAAFTALPDDALVGWMRAARVLRVAEPAEARLAGGALQTGPLETALRAKAIVAADAVVAASRARSQREGGAAAAEPQLCALALWYFLAFDAGDAAAELRRQGAPLAPRCRSTAFY